MRQSYLHIQDYYETRASEKQANFITTDFNDKRNRTENVLHKTDGGVFVAV